MEAHQNVSCTNTGRISEGRGIKKMQSQGNLYTGEVDGPAYAVVNQL